MSVSSSESERKATEYEAPLNAEEVYYILLHKLDAEEKKLDNHAKKAENTNVSDSWKDIMGRDAAETLIQFKSKVYEAMKEEFDKRHASSFHSFDRYLEERVTQSLTERCERNEALITYLDNEMKTIQKLTNLANNRAKDLETNLKEKQAKQKMLKEDFEADFKKKQERVEKKHRKLVRAVRSVTPLASPQKYRELDRILGTLLDKSFEPNAYVEEEEGWEGLVEFLLRTEMVVRHPDDKKMIRLVDFM